MADDDEVADHAGRGMDSPPPPKRFSRMRAVPQTLGMGVKGTVAFLQQEADSIRRTGISAMLKEGFFDSFEPLKHRYLSGSAAQTYSDETGAQYEANNRAVYEKIPEAIEISSTTGTVAQQFDQELCLNLHCHIISQIRLGPDDVDHMPSVYLDTAEGSHKKSGGFQTLYPNINVKSVFKAEQERCIFAMKPAAFKKVGSAEGIRLVKAAEESVKAVVGDSATLVEALILFHWNDHSFFTYHQDPRGDWVLLVNLSPATTDFHIAGTQGATMETAGEAHLFPTKVFHRSGKAPRRCVKVAFFFNVAKPGDASGSGSTPVKTEVKTEESNTATETAQDVQVEQFSTA